MGLIEEKKQKLGINELEFKEQKGLYQDFVDVGGKVVDLGDDPRRKLNQKIENWIETKEEQEKRRLLEEERKRQAEEMRLKALQQKEIIKKAYRQKEEEVKKAPPVSVPKPPAERNPTQDLFARLASKIVCMLYGIFTLFGGKFTRSFINLNNSEVVNSLIEAKQILVSIIHQDKEFSRSIRQAMADTGYPFYYELLYRLDTLFDEDLFRLFRETMVSDRPIIRSKSYFIKFFKKILLLNRYAPSLSNAVEQALFLESQKRNLSEGIYQSNLRKMTRTMGLLFNVYFPKILNLVDYYYKDELAAGKKASFKDFLGISDADTLGSLTRQWIEEEKREKILQEEAEKIRIFEEEHRRKLEEEGNKDTEKETQAENAEMEELLSQFPEPIRFGIKLFRQNVNFNDVMDYYFNTKDARMNLPLGDKVFLSQTLLEFFDKEYSFLFLTSAVQYNIFFDRGQRRDLRSTFKDLYYHIDEAYKKGTEYVRVVSEIRKLNSNSYLNAREQYVRLNQLSLQRSQISRSVRSQIRDLGLDFLKLFKIVLEDYEQEKHIIQNPDEELNYETKIAGRKINHKHTVIDSFANAYYFACALNFFTGDGELGGSGVSIKSSEFLKVTIPPMEEKDLSSDEN